MMWKAVILATGLYIMAIDGGIVAYHPLNVPHPLGLCPQEKELSLWASERIRATHLEEVPAMLIRENLGTRDPRHDWCVPRYHIRKTLPPDSVWPEPFGRMPVVARLPPRRVYP